MSKSFSECHNPAHGVDHHIAGSIMANKCNMEHLRKQRQGKGAAGTPPLAPAAAAAPSVTTVGDEMVQGFVQSGGNMENLGIDFDEDLDDHFTENQITQMQAAVNENADGVVDDVKRLMVKEFGEPEGGYSNDREVAMGQMAAKLDEMYEQHKVNPSEENVRKLELINSEISHAYDSFVEEMHPELEYSKAGKLFGLLEAGHWPEDD